MMITPQHATATGPPVASDPAVPRVLLASDDAATARVAEAWIRRLRWARTPTVDVVTVAPNPPLAARIGLQTYRTAVREAVAQLRDMDLLVAQRIANGVAARLQEDGTVVRVWARQGNVADEIVAIGRLETPDLIVVGGGADSPRPFSWGVTTSAAVARESGVPVLITGSQPDHGRLPRAIRVDIADAVAGRRALHWLRWVGWPAGAELTLAWGVELGDADRASCRQLTGELGAGPVLEVELADTGAGRMDGVDLLVLPGGGSGVAGTPVLPRADGAVLTLAGGRSAPG